MCKFLTIQILHQLVFPINHNFFHLIYYTHFLISLFSNSTKVLHSSYFKRSYEFLDPTLIICLFEIFL